MEYAEHRPPAALRPHLECLWSVTGLGVREPQRVVPDGCPELIVHLGDVFERRVGARWVRQPRLFLAGTLTRPWLLRPGRRVITLGARFRPGAVTSLFPRSMAGMADREIAIEDLAGVEEKRQLQNALRRARSGAARIAALGSWLVARIGPERPEGARPAVALVLRTRGAERIAGTAKTLGWTPRRLERAFLHDLGIRPKLFARIVRLNAVLASLDERERGSAIDLALDAGYFDQAHLLRDFRTLAGRKPGAGRTDGALARHFTHPERLKALFDSA